MAEGHTPECVLTDRNLVDISNNIGNGWESLAVFLKIPQTQIDHIKADHKQSMQQQIYNMLLMWKNTEGCNATLTSLLDEMKKVAGVTINWNALHNISGPVVDNVLQTRKGHCQQACTLVSLDIDKTDLIPAPTSVPQVPLTISYKEVLTKAHMELVLNMEPAPLLDHFIENKFLSIQKARDIAELPTTSEKNREIIQILHTRTEDGYKLFKTCLQKSNQEDLVDKLTEFETILSQEEEQPRDPVIPSEENISAEERTIFKMLQHDLISYYRELLRKLQFSPLFEEDEYAANFFDLYVKPILTIPSQRGPNGQTQSTPIKTFHDVFVRNFKPCKHIYISSPAGCGKTSILKYMTLTWCQAHKPIVSDNQWLLDEDINEMKTFKHLFFVYLRDSHESECDVDIMIQQLLCRLANPNKYANSGFLQKLLSNFKCIILLDGLDEWNHPQEKKCLWPHKHIPHSRVRPLCTTLTTSRPWKLDVVKLKPEDIDQKLELNGLEGDLLKCLIGNVVTKLNKVHQKEMKAYDFERKLLDKKLTDLSKIPVVIMQLLVVWFDKQSLGESQCEIYSNMIEFLLKRYCKKKEIVSEIEDMEVDDCSRDRQTPMCLQNNRYCKVHMELLSKLATLSYNTLFTDNKESSLVFDRKIAKNYLKTDKAIEMSLAVGILTQEKVLGKVSIQQSHISFIHKTFQEYLAALYVALSPGTVTIVEKKFKHVCCSIEKILEMSQIFMFLSGLCPKVMVNLHEHLRQTVSEDSGTQRYRAKCEMHPGELEPVWSAEGETLNRVQYTMLEWLDECWLNGHKHITHLPVRDFLIWSPSRWSAGLKSLAVHNSVCTLYVNGDVYSPEEIEDILNSVTLFNSIQKLWLNGVSETFVIKLVSQHKHSLSVRPKTWSQLGWVTLWAVRMSGGILCSLVDSILQLPKSVRVRLEHCGISQGTRDWKAYIRFHPRLSVDEYVVVDDVVCDVVDRRWRMNVNLLQFHTNKVRTCSTM